MKKICNRKWTKESLIKLFLELSKDRQITRKEWNKHPDTPSDMPIRCLFKTWNNFIIECGGTPYKPYLSEIAKQNTILAHKGKRSFAWKGGKIKDSHGYILIWKPEHPQCKSAGYIHEHRLVMSEFLGRPLTSEETVHHKNGDRSDNRIENLELWSKSHPAGQRVIDKIEWAVQFLTKYGAEIKINKNIFETPELLK